MLLMQRIDDLVSEVAKLSVRVKEKEGEIQGLEAQCRDHVETIEMTDKARRDEAARANERVR